VVFNGRLAIVRRPDGSGDGNEVLVVFRRVFSIARLTIYAISNVDTTIEMDIRVVEIRDEYGCGLMSVCSVLCPHDIASWLKS
jgi:hypothetical protein